MILQSGYVAIRPHDAGGTVIGPAVLRDNINPERWVTVRGRIVAVSPVMRYHGRKILKEIQVRSESNMDDLRQLYALSLPADAPVGVRTGDEVLFNYMTTMVHDLGMNEDSFYGDLVIVPYSYLIARIEGEDMVPLGGLVLLRMETKEDTVGWMRNRRREMIEHGSGIVVAQGSRVLQYLDTQDEDPDVCLVGKRVFFNRHNAVRIEYDLVAKVKQNGLPLYSVRLSDILYYELSGKRL
jgi:hypothetical protein